MAKTKITRFFQAMNYIFGNNTISIEESMLGFMEGNPVSFGILEVLFLMPFEDIFSHA